MMQSLMISNVSINKLFVNSKSLLACTGKFRFLIKIP